MSYYLGFDSSTQSLKAVIVDNANWAVSDALSVNFGKDLPEYSSPAGVLHNDDPKICHANPMMWLDAMDMLFRRMQEASWPLNEVAAISGSGQQHGSVYVNASFEDCLGRLTPDHSLVEQLQGCLSRKTSPIWMDASTENQCKMLEDKFGKRMRAETGSCATERFTGPQIMKFAQEEPETWAKTAKAHLVSSFMASVLAGKSAPIDYGDGAGMNLLDLSKLCWHGELASFMAPGLLEKLPPCVASNTIYGHLSPYFEKYGLKSGIPLVAWTGDNPSSLIGCGGGAENTAVISLGTSDTLFGAMSRLSDAPEHFGHVFGNPAGGFMSLVCFSNGSLAREKIRQKLQLDWDGFNSAAAGAEPGKHLLLPYFVPECTPFVPVPEVKANFYWEQAPAGILARAILESQALTMRYHAELKHPLSSIRLTGGASANTLFAKIIADVFQAPVLLGNTRETAALGAAIRAISAKEQIDIEAVQQKVCQISTTVMPNKQLAECYDKALSFFLHK